MAELGRLPLRNMHFGSLEAIIGCVSAGLGATFMPKAVVDHERYGEDVTTHPVPERFSKISTLFIRRRDMAPSTNLKIFLEKVKRYKLT